MTDPDQPAVPGLGRADGQPLDMSQDPDRYDPARDTGPVFDPDEHPRVVEPVGPLDMSQDPDRFLPPGQGQSLTDLLGKAGTYEGDRDGYQWIAGLLGVLAFLALVAFLFQSVLEP